MEQIHQWTTQDLESNEEAQTKNHEELKNWMNHNELPLPLQLLILRDECYRYSIRVANIS